MGSISVGTMKAMITHEVEFPLEIWPKPAKYDVMDVEKTGLREMGDGSKMRTCLM